MPGYPRPSPGLCPKCQQSRRLPRRFGCCASTSNRRWDSKRIASAGVPPPFEYEGAQYQPCSQTCVPSLFVPSCARWQEPDTTIPRLGRKSNGSFARGLRAEVMRIGMGTEGLSRSENTYGPRYEVLTAGDLMDFGHFKNGPQSQSQWVTLLVSGHL